MAGGVVEATPHLRLANPDGVIPDGGPSYSDAIHKIRDLEDQLVGYKETCDKQSRQIGALTRRINEIEDPDHQPANSEVIALVERWRTLSHPKAKVSKDRVRLVKARLADDFAITDDEWLPSQPTLELAVDGVASHPFLLYGKRKREGAESNRYDDLKDALGDAAKVEEAARAGYLARKEGWTLENGWPS